MTQKEKSLLLKDLSARLPYGVIVDYKDNVYDYHHWKISSLYTPTYSRNGNLINTDLDGWITYEDYKGCGMSTGSRQLRLEINLPFLRPMSSMTEEEKSDFMTHVIDEPIIYDKDTNLIIGFECNTFEQFALLENWLNAHHFDYRGLIEKGLALEAPEGMY